MSRLLTMQFLYRFGNIVGKDISLVKLIAHNREYFESALKTMAAQ